MQNALANRLAQVTQSVNGALSSQAGDIRIIAEESSNSLLVRATESDFALVQQIIGTVDLRPLQVLIEVTIAEVQRTHDLDLGVSGTVKRIPNGKTAADVTATAPSQASARDFIVQLTGGNGTIKYDVAIAALQERGDVRVLSLPVIIAQNNRQAMLNVGSSRPFVQVSQTVPNDPTGRVQTVQYIDVGTVLTITPTINPDGYVNLSVDADGQQRDERGAVRRADHQQARSDDADLHSRRADDGHRRARGQHAQHAATRAFRSSAASRSSVRCCSAARRSTRRRASCICSSRRTSSRATTDMDKLRDAVKDGSELLKERERRSAHRAEDGHAAAVPARYAAQAGHDAKAGLADDASPAAAR